MQPQSISHRSVAGNRITLFRRIMGKRSRVVPVSIAGIGLTALVIGALIPSAQKAAQSRPVGPSLKVPSGKAVKQAHVEVSAQTAEPSVGSPGRRSISFYTGDVRAGMFSEPVAPAPPAPPAPKPPAAVPPAPVDPFADWNYTGSATIGTDKVAILENINTHDGVLLHVGENFMGSKVAEIDGDYLTLGTHASPKVLRVSMNSSYVPLSKSASFLTAQPQQPQGPAMPGGPANGVFAMRNAGNVTGGPSVTLPNGTVLSGTQMQRYQNRLNRGWNGGGGAGGGGGRRGGGGMGGGGATQGG